MPERRLMGLQALLFSLAMAMVVGAVVFMAEDWSQPNVSLLQTAGTGNHPPHSLHSAKYYQQLAEADNWLLGPARRAKQHAAKARLQLLAEQPHSPLAGMQGMIKACADGSNRACASIAARRNTVKALEAARDTSRSRREAATTRQRKSFDLSANNGIWDPRNWQSGELDTLGNVASNQWLAACGEGDARACADIARSKHALDNLLLSSSRPGPPLKAYMKTKAPKPVFVARKEEEGTGLFSEALSFLGLGDKFYGSGVKKTAHVPKMIPDRGLHRGPKYSAVWNDGTVAPSLSDEPGRRSLDTDAALQLFSDNVQQKPTEYPFH